MATDPRQVTKSFTLMGSSFISGAGALIDKLRPSSPLTLKRQPDNKADKNAVLLILALAEPNGTTVNSRALGWLPKQLAAEIAPFMDAGINVIVRKAPPLPKYGAYKGIFELAYIPEDPNAEEQAPDSPVAA